MVKRAMLVVLIAMGTVLGLATPAMAATNDNMVYVLRGNTLLHRVTEAEAAGLAAYKYCHHKISRNDAHWLAVVADSGQGSRTFCTGGLGGYTYRVSDS
jgi:putative Ca2+/H+ antiporter (TMEM165/GDT1 family)